MRKIIPARTIVAALVVAVAFEFLPALRADAQEAPSTQAPSTSSDPGAAATPNGSAAPRGADGDNTGKDTSKKDAAKKGRIFWFIPNFTTIEEGTPVGAVTTKETFGMAVQDSFDPFAFPYVAVFALEDHLSNEYPTWEHGLSGFGKLYAAAFADNVSGSFLADAIVPWVFRQDPRYFQRGSGSVASRAEYALSRIVITHSKHGSSEFNVSEIGGNGIAAFIGNAYYPASAHPLSAAISRWGSQVALDAISFELKEFWPDIRRKLHH